MNRMRLILLAAAILAAALAAYLSTGLMRQRPAPPVPPVVQKPATVDVLVAARNVATGEQLGNLGLQWRPWPAERRCRMGLKPCRGRVPELPFW